MDIDDIVPGTQEYFHLFGTLAEGNEQIVLTVGGGKQEQADKERTQRFHQRENRSLAMKQIVVAIGLLVRRSWV